MTKQDLISDTNCGMQFFNKSVTNIAQIELRLETDCIRPLNQGEGVKISDVKIDGCTINACALQLGNTGNNNYVNLISPPFPDLGITYDIILPNTAPTDNDLLVYNGSLGRLEWSQQPDSLDLTNLGVENLTVGNLSVTGFPNNCGDLYVNTGTTLAVLPLGTTGQVLATDFLNPSNPLCIKWTDPGELGISGGGGGGDGIFGSNLFCVEDLGQETTTSNSYINRLTLNLTAIEAGEYLITWCYILQKTKNRRGGQVRVQIDNSETVYQVKEKWIQADDDSSSDNYTDEVPHKCCVKRTLTAGNHFIDLDFRRINSSYKAIRIINPSIMAYRVA